MNNKNSMSKATYRYFRIMELKRLNLNVSWCTVETCQREIIWVDFYPLHEGLCKACRKEKALEKAPQDDQPQAETS
jgi:hypothetical protein